MTIEIPEILNVPPKLLPVITRINDYRYFLLEGGRSSGKSQTTARLICYLCEKQQVSVVCGREVQNSIEESVYRIFVDLIRAENLYFDIHAQKIIHKGTGSEIHFRGFREQGMMNIKGLEGVDILWVDEAQAITKNTLDVIIPTIRKEKAKIYWTMNRHLEDDPVFKKFASRPDCLRIHIDYLENPFCPDAMIFEAGECKNKSEIDYNHIWLGQPLVKGEDKLLGFDIVTNAINLVFNSEGTSRIILACDVARFGDNETIFTGIKSKNIMQWEQIFQEAKKGWDTMQTTGYVLELKRQFRPDAIVIDDVGVGGGVTDRLREQMTPPIPFIANAKSINEVYEDKRTEGYFMLRDLFLKGHLKILNDNELMEQLLSVKFKYKSNGRKVIASKDEMRKEGLKSPDRADALMMAVSQTKNIFNRILYSTSNLPREAEVSTVLI